MIFDSEDIKLGSFPDNWYEEFKLPRVTKILSFIDSEGLIDWANRMGRCGKDNKEILKNAGDYGTKTHTAIEKFLKYQEEPVDRIIAFDSFKKWYNDVWTKNDIKILGQEETLFAKGLFAGTYDLLLSINGKVYLMDFKTSNHVGYKYCMQLAAYRYMLRERKNLEIDGAIVLQVDKNKPKYTEYFLDLSKESDRLYMEDCERAMIMLTMLYHEVYWLKNNFPF